MKDLPMNILLIGVSLAIAIFCYRVFISSDSHNSLFAEHDHDHSEIPADQVHLHAGFLIYVDEELQNYDDDKWMHWKPCTAEDYAKFELTDPYDRIHLHDNIGNVVHVHAPGVTWRELFLSMELEELLERDDMTMYRNGEVEEAGLDLEVKQLDSVIFMFGKRLPQGTDITQDSAYVSKERILEAENSSESCGA